MKKIFSILLSVALLVSLGALTTAPVTAATLPSITPTSATYNLDDVAQIVVGIDFGTPAGSLANITNIGNGTILVGGDYELFETILVLKTSYLSGALPMPGQTLTLQFNFLMPGPYVYDCMLTITSTGTNPAVLPTSVDWSWNTKGNVTAAILWGIANDVSSVGDDVGLLPGSNWTHNSTALIIDESYFKIRWPSSTNISSSVVLNVKFNKGSNATLTVKCVGTATPSLAPLIVYWDYLKSPQQNVTSTITWGAYSTIYAVLDYTYPNLMASIGAGNWTRVGNTLYIFPSWLTTVLNDNMSKNGYTYRLLVAVFNPSGTALAPLVVVAGPSSPSIAPATANWDLDKDLSIQTNWYVYTVPAFYPASAALSVKNVTDQWGYNLTIYTGIAGTGGACNKSWPENFDYRVAFNPILNAFVVSFWKCYFLSPNPISTLVPLAVPGNVSVLTLAFDKGLPVTFTVTATGGGAKLAPAAVDFNLDEPADVATTVTWGKWATNITSITGSVLTRGVDYTLVPDGALGTTSTLTIKASYLSSVLAQPDDTVTLTVVFNAGASAALTITGVGTPSCFIATAVGANAAQLDVLRAFRDNVLRGNALGDAVIRAYYTVSPSIAKVIAGNAALKAVVKLGVDLIAGILS